MTASTIMPTTPPTLRAARYAGHIRATLSAAAIAMLAGCASTGVVHVGAARSAKPANCALDVYASRADVTRPFDSVCVVSSESGSTLLNDRSDEGRLRAVSEQACACGADAIVIRDMSRSATQFGRGYSQARLAVEAIAYRASK